MCWLITLAPLGGYIQTNRLWLCPGGRKSLDAYGDNYAWSRAQNVIGSAGSDAAVFFFDAGCSKLFMPHTFP